MPRIRIAVDPALKAKFGPEICWAWRFVLSGIGLAWEEVPADSANFDIGYFCNDIPEGKCKIYIRANAAFWQDNSTAGLYEISKNSPIEKSGRVIFEQDIIFFLFWLLSGRQESRLPKDKHGQVVLAKDERRSKEILALALASDTGLKLEKCLMNSGFAPLVPRWPEGKAMAACVSHDVDYPEIVRWLEPLRIIQRQGLKGFKGSYEIFSAGRNHWNFTRWVSLEKALGISSAFYFMATQGSLYKYATGTPDAFYDIKERRFRGAFNLLNEDGFEIGLHASYRAFESKDKFSGEKLALEEASGREVSGNRHHYLHLNPAAPEETLLLHEKIGLKYDTSLMHERYLGFRRGSAWPFYPFSPQEKREIKVLQLPTVWMDNQLFGYAKDNPGERDEILRSLAKRVAGQGGCFLINIHDYVFDEVLFPDWRDTYVRLWEYLSGRRDCWFERPCVVAGHWAGRYARILAESRGLSEGC